MSSSRLMMLPCYCTVMALFWLMVSDQPRASAGLLGTQRVASGLTNPVYVTHAPGDTDRLFITEKGGTIKILNINTGVVNSTPFLTIPDTDSAGEGGLLGMAFHPDYSTNGKFYVHVTVDNGGLPIDGVTSPFSSHIREYLVSSGDPDVANAASQLEIFSWVQPRSNHNAGWIGFNPQVSPSDPQFLYIMSGDGGKQRDPDNNAQTIVNEPLGKVLRIDVDADAFPSDPSRNYAVPSGNPFVNQTGDDEIWAYGLRNPWRASFDRQTGDLWIGDVGQNAREEIDFQAADSNGGENYAWNRREGTISHQGGASLPGDTEPVYDYVHGSDEFDGNSVVGGYIYRGPDPDLQGSYIFADTISGNIWSFDPADPTGTVENILPSLTPDIGSIDFPVSFGEDALGNLYIVDFSSSAGEIFRMNAAVPEPSSFSLAALGALLLAFWRRFGR